MKKVPLAGPLLAALAMSPAAHAVDPIGPVGPLGAADAAQRAATRALMVCMATLHPDQCAETGQALVRAAERHYNAMMPPEVAAEHLRTLDAVQAWIDCGKREADHSKCEGLQKTVEAAVDAERAKAAAAIRAGK